MRLREDLYVPSARLGHLSQILLSSYHPTSLRVLGVLDNQYLRPKGANDSEFALMNMENYFSILKLQTPASKAGALVIARSSISARALLAGDGDHFSHSVGQVMDQIVDRGVFFLRIYNLLGPEQVS